MFKKVWLFLLVALIGLTITSGCMPGKNQQGNSDQQQPAPNDPPAQNQVAFNIYFLKEVNGNLEPFSVTRQASLENDEIAAKAKRAYEFLLQGPTSIEVDAGLLNSMPKATLNNIDYQRPHLTLNLSKEFEQIGGTYQVDNLLKQLTMTMASIEGIKSIIIEVEGERVGTSEKPYTGEGLLFNNLTPPTTAEQYINQLTPVDVLDLFIATIPDKEKMWSLMGPKARATYQSTENIDDTAYSEGLGSWRDYRITEEKIDGDRAMVTIQGDQNLEGQLYPDATYTAALVKENGSWKWDFPQQN